MRGMRAGRRPAGIIASALPLAVVLSSCGPTTAADGVEATGTDDAATDAGSTAADDVATAADSSTGADPWDPTRGCNPGFDLGLATGAIVWTQQFTANVEAAQRALSVAADPSGIVYAAGFYRFPNDVNHGWLHALSPDGAPRWEVRYDGENLEEAFTDVATTPSGDVIVVGYELISNLDPFWSYPEIVAVVIAYSASGEVAWRTEVAHVGWSPPTVAVGPDGRVVVAATSRPQNLDEHPALLLADISPTGELSSTWAPPSDPYLYLDPADVQLDAAGNLYVLATGATAESGMAAEWLGRWDAVGSFLGAVAHEHEEAGAVAVNPRADGALVLGHGEPYAFRPSLRRYDENGVELWASTVEMEGEVSLAPFALTTDCAGQALVAAESNGAFWLFWFDDQGSELSRLQLESGQWWAFHGMAVDSFGNPVLAGMAYGDDVYPLAVRKYAR